VRCQEAQRLVMQYINKDLLGRQLEEFLEHVKTCKDCYEELEIYYTIQFALQQLENNEEVVYNIHNSLVEDLLQTSKKIYKKRHQYIYSLIIVFLAQMAVIITLVAQLQIWNTGTLEETAIYKIRMGAYYKENNIIIQEPSETETLLESESNLGRGFASPESSETDRTKEGLLGKPNNDEQKRKITE
jgi:hypothetical protein